MFNLLTNDMASFLSVYSFFFLKVLERPFRRRSQVGKLADRYKARTPETPSLKMKSKSGVYVKTT